MTGLPFAWLFLHREFSTARFRWAVFLLIVGQIAVQAWAKLGMRCRCCGIPFLVYRFLESVTQREKHRFLDPTRCPYCGDDGTGKTGDLSKVDPTEEAREIRRSIRTTVLVSLAVIGIPFLAAVAYFAVVAYRHGLL